VQIRDFDDSPLEKVLEAWTREQVRRLGGVAYKFTSPGHRSVPDRLLLFPGGRVLFMELKRKGKKATPKQLLEHEKLRRLGFRVEVCDTKERVLEVLRTFFVA
jgi:hypothetical protein